MTIYLVRHGHAGKRNVWSERDELRPLSKKGEAEARGLAAKLAGAGIEALWSSPFTRCVQTLEPLGELLGTGVEPHQALAEGASLSDTMALVDAALHRSVALCSHGDVLPGVLAEIEASGVAVAGDHHTQKGAWWELGTDGRRITTATYHPPIRA